MRYLLAPIAFVFAACSPGPAGPAGPVGPQGAVGAAGDTSGLVAEIAALRGELAEVRARAVVKVAHWVVAETGEDLGIFLDVNTTFLESMKAPIAWKPAAFFYESADCDGQAFASPPARPALYGVTPWGTLYTTKPSGRQVTAQSQRLYGSPCMAGEALGVPSAVVTDSGIAYPATSIQNAIVESR